MNGCLLFNAKCTINVSIYIIKEQVTFRGDDVDIRYVLDQQA
jgi:hypothetical protein